MASTRSSTSRIALRQAGVTTHSKGGKRSRSQGVIDPDYLPRGRLDPPSLDAEPDGGEPPHWLETEAPARQIITATSFVWIDPAKIPRRRWLYGRHYIRNFLSATVAPGAFGKTSRIIVEALALTTGRPLLGVTPDEQVNVWYWTGEDPADELQRRVAAACLHYEIDVVCPTPRPPR